VLESLPLLKKEEEDKINNKVVLKKQTVELERAAVV
jgi:hypothetical protein